MENLGERIKQQRLSKKMTVEELSQKTMLSTAVIHDIENGAFDRYKGDEAYVKMYLKKISEALEMDNNEVTQAYVALTQEIKQAELLEAEEKMHNEADVQKKREFNFEKPSFTRHKSVYEDNSKSKIIKYVLAILVVFIIICVLWYGLYATKSKVDEPTYNETNQNVEGEVLPDDSGVSEGNTDTNESTDNGDGTLALPNTGTTTTGNISFVRNGVLDFDFTLPQGTEEFTFKIEFVSRSWASLQVNNKAYSEFESKIYNNSSSEEPETVELTFKVEEFENLKLNNGYSVGHKYYINGQQIPLTEEDSFTSTSTLKLKLVKE